MGRHKTRPSVSRDAILGNLVRRVRKNRGLTLVELGSRTGLSHGFLSQVERGLSQPSLSTIRDIADALGIPLGALMPTASSGYAHLARNGEAPEFHLPADVPQVLARVLTTDETQMKIIETRGTWDEPVPVFSHFGEEAVYVIEGQLEIDIGGRTFVLGAGDVLTFDCSVRHRYRALGTEELRALVITVDPGRYGTAVDEKEFVYRLAHDSP